MSITFYKKINPIIYLWMGQGVSAIGTMVYTIALSWYVIDETGSPFIMGTVLLVSMIPKIALSVMAGLLGDKVSKKKFLITIDLIRFTLTVAWGGSLIQRPFSLVEIYIFTFILSMIDAAFNPVYNAFIPELMRKDNLTRAASVNQIVFRIAAILAPTVAGFAIIRFSFSEFVIINGITFLIAAISTSLVKAEKTISNTNSKKESLVSQIKNGFSYFWDNKLIFWSVFLITLANIGVVSYNVNIVNLVQNELRLSSNVYGLVLTFYSSGSLIAFLLLSIVNFKRIRGYIYILSLMVGGLLYMCILFVENAALLCLVFFLIGFLFACASTISTTILFEIPSEEFRGRVLGIASISSLLSPLGFLIWGAVGSIVSSSVAMSLAGVIIVITAIIGVKTPIIKYN